MTTAYLRWLLSASLLLFILPLPLHSAQKSDVLLGQKYYYAGEYSRALDCYAASLDKAEKSGNVKDEAAALGNIGLIFFYIDDARQGIYYTRRAYQLAHVHHLLQMERKSASVLAAAYCEHKQLDSARYYNNVQKRVPTRGYVEGNYLSFSNDGEIADAEGRHSLARYYYNRAIDYIVEHGMDSAYVLSQCINMGDSWLLSHKPRQAINWYHRAESIGQKQQNMHMLQNVYKRLADAWRTNGNRNLYKKYHYLSMTLADSLLDSERMNVARSKLFEYEKHVDHVNFLSLHRMVSVQWVAITIIALLALIATLFLFFSNRQNKRLRQTQRLLIDRNHELQAEVQRTQKLRQQLAATYSENHNQQSEKENNRYNAGINERDKNEMVMHITEILQNDEVISDKSFNLTVLVTMLNSNSTYVSWVINDAFGKTFKALLNEYRIRLACRRLEDQKYSNVTIQAIYESVGYSSASSFIKAFKDINGMTPSAYQRLTHGEKESSR